MSTSEIESENTKNHSIRINNNLLIIFGDAIVALCVLTLPNQLCKSFVMCNNNQLKVLLPSAILHYPARLLYHTCNLGVLEIHIHTLLDHSDCRDLVRALIRP